MEAFFIRRLLLGEGRPSDTREQWTQFAYDPMPVLFAVLTDEIDSLVSTGDIEQDLELLLFAINNMTSELIPPQLRLESIHMVLLVNIIIAGVGSEA
ncbi:hypothetical protein LOZ80_06945 [Paenibacillus sp. HWE-109]|uniref:hypothetical protein n=1 Tax=Paenibacillus sp. HWE-109 TaxID=1306526 RepID=UPI001EE03B8D|nr:hypothetical protein [Paenibacillus sp. HWE-109]UKS28655.1 hypothetical protein LOZ80_06945 [Paenibacillus sp. HWE-109]